MVIGLEHDVGILCSASAVGTDRGGWAGDVADPWSASAAGMDCGEGGARHGCAVVVVGGVGGARFKAQRGHVVISVCGRDREEGSGARRGRAVVGGC